MITEKQINTEIKLALHMNFTGKLTDKEFKLTFEMLQNMKIELNMRDTSFTK